MPRYQYRERSKDLLVHGPLQASDSGLINVAIQQFCETLLSKAFESSAALCHERNGYREVHFVSESGLVQRNSRRLGANSGYWHPQRMEQSLVCSVLLVRRAHGRRGDYYEQYYLFGWTSCRRCGGPFFLRFALNGQTK